MRKAFIVNSSPDRRTTIWLGRTRLTIPKGGRVEIPVIETKDAEAAVMPHTNLTVKVEDVAEAPRQAKPAPQVPASVAKPVDPALVTKPAAAAPAAKPAAPAAKPVILGTKTATSTAPRQVLPARKVAAPAKTPSPVVPANLEKKD